MAAAAAHSVQLLADVIALEFSQSLTSEQCAGALRRLLPGLQYLSIAVTNPAQPASIVASANCAVPGPTTLHLHDATSCAAGLALARGEPLQASLAGEAPEAVHAWTDVQQMAAAAPAVTHLLCVPFGANHDSSDCISDGGEETRCPQHAPVGSGCGALMFGLAQQPRLSERQAALLARLARSLPAPMARLSGDALAFVNFATGNVARCSCCCDGDSEGEEGGGEPGSPCGDGRRSGGGGGVGPSQAVPVPAAVTPALQIEDGAECSRQQGALRDQLRGKGSKQAAAAAQQPEPVSLPQHPAPLVGGHEHRFSKAALAAAGEGGAATAQHPLTLAFRSPLVEGEYAEWAASTQKKQGDTLALLLLLAALLLVAFVRPYRLLGHAQGSLVLGLGAVLPLAFTCLSRPAYMPVRAWLVAAFRLAVISLINMACLSAYQAHQAGDHAQQWLTFWRLTGAESLCVTALGFRMQLQHHLPMQVVALAIVAWNLPPMCSQCYPGVEAGVCFRSSAAMAAVCGFLLPTLCLRQLEQRSRALFASQLHAAAARTA